MINKRYLGKVHEEKAAEFLSSKGYTILALNYHCRRGEIDIVARDKGTLVFTEVKYRKGNASGFPLDAVDFRKQQRIIYAAKFYMMEHHIPEDHPCRFDVISILGDTIEHIEDAFWL